MSKCTNKNGFVFWRFSKAHLACTYGEGWVGVLFVHFVFLFEIYGKMGDLAISENACYE